MPGFCFKCGTKLDATSKFCPKCGTPVGNERYAHPVPEKPQTPAPQRCGRCGAELKGTEAFCAKCGSPVGDGQSVPATTRDLKTPDRGQFTPTVKNVVSTLERTVFSAPNAAGEFALGSVGSVASVLTPVKVISGGFKNLISSVKGFFKNPKAMIPTLCISAVWLVLNILKASGVDNTATRIFSTLSFSNAGMGTNVIGILGGILGKGVFAAALVTFIYMISGIGRNKGRGFIGTLKSSFGFDLNTVWSYTLGVGLALLLFVFMAWKIDYTSFMGGLAASFMAARSALKGGFLSRFLTSFESKSKVRIFEGVPRGMASGFAIGAMLGFIPNCTLGILIAGAVVTVVGLVMVILQKAGVFRPGGKEESAV